MINVGDVVLVTIPTWWPGFLTVGFGDPTYNLQRNVEQLGFQVVSNNAGALSYVTIGGPRANLKIAVKPYASAYATAQDVASVVASAAAGAGFDTAAGASAQVVGYASPLVGQPSSGQYERNQNEDDKDPDANKSVFDDIAKAFGISKTTAEVAVIGAAAMMVLVLVKVK